MEFTLKNIGIIKDSKIKLDGLTVITGPNNSGKSTIGKALYSVIKTENTPKAEYEKEIEKTKSNTFIKIAEEFKFNSIAKYIKVRNDSMGTIISLFSLVSSIHILNSLANNYDTANEKSMSLGKGFDLLSDFLEKVNKEYLLNISTRDGLEDPYFKEYLDGFDTKISNARDLYKKTKDLIYTDENYQLFTMRTFSRTLESEFSGQVISNIFSCKGGDTIGRLILTDNKQILDDVYVDSKGAVQQNHFTFRTMMRSNVILFDDAYAVDDLNKHTKWRGANNHVKYLLDCLQTKENETIFEEEMSKVDIKHILELIANSYPGAMSNMAGVYTYSDDIIKDLFIENLATGSKCFAVIKQLIENRQIRRNTMLILDEPESHLHPEWQNVFAEIITILVKEWDVKVLLTTHSPNFLLALDTYAMKHKIVKVTHFYQSKHNVDHSVSFDCADDKINEVYANLSLPFIELDALRSELLAQEAEGDED